MVLSPDDIKAKQVLDDKFKKICYLINDDNEMIVDKNNVHYFSDTKEYQSLKDKLIPDYIY